MSILLHTSAKGLTTKPLVSAIACFAAFIAGQPCGVAPGHALGVGLCVASRINERQ
jgi:hypothetical protein